MRYVYARESQEIQASERAALAPESDPQGRNGADVELSEVRQKGEVHQVRDRGQFTPTPSSVAVSSSERFLICELGGLESNVAAQHALLRLEEV